ncbi:MAG TPA: DUF4397 domain-containing protein [Gemmatimonadaceae bacterium]|nr:DUF4397 domain-containing protein [Gemmatimonadaceae bacterium]
MRFINGLADSSAVDVRMIDQVDFSLNGVQAIGFRAGTEHQPVEAKARHLRVFPNSINPTITSAFMVDTTITFAANSRYTLLLTRETATHVHLVVISDDVPAPAAGQIAVRAVNASTGAVDAYLVTSFTATDPVSPPAAAANIAPLGASSYISRAIGNAAFRFTPTGSGTVSASAAGPSTTAPLPGQLPAAAVNSAGTAFSVYYFPRSVAGTSAPQATTPVNFTVPGVVWFVDRNPADQ